MGDCTASLVFGVSVDPFKLLYHAKAWKENQHALAYLDGLIDGELEQDPDLPYTLPNEILDHIRHHLWDSAVAQYTCRSWAYYGKTLKGRVHPPDCCQAAHDY